jgi:hypothetical protein
MVRRTLDAGPFEAKLSQSLTRPVCRVRLAVMRPRRRPVRVTPRTHLKTDCRVSGRLPIALEIAGDDAQAAYSPKRVHDRRCHIRMVVDAIPGLIRRAHIGSHRPRYKDSWPLPFLTQAKWVNCSTACGPDMPHLTVINGDKPVPSVAVKTESAREWNRSSACLKRALPAWPSPS